MSANESGASTGKESETAADESRAQYPLPPQAKRALAEAEARRNAGALDPKLPPEVKGRKGPEAVRYGDWEKDGIAVDF